MPETRIVRPETRRLEISGGDWLLVKRRLNAGEQRGLFARMYHANGDGRRVLDPLQTGPALILAYLLDWSLVDERGSVLAIRDEPDEVKQAALDAIDYESFVEIRTAIERHQEANDLEETAKKKTRSGAPASDPTSTLPAAATGAMSG